MTTIKLENVFKKAEELLKKIFNSRFLIYKIVLSLVAVVLVSSGGFWAWQRWQGNEAAQAGWYDNSWTRRYQITINEEYTQGDLTDFPVLVATTTLDLARAARSDGRDIIFTDISGTQLSREIEHYDATTGELVAWVKASSVASSTDTILYMYYGNSSYDTATSTGAEAVWDSSYTGVWHFHTDTASTTPDATSYGNDGSLVGTASSTSGKIGNAVNTISLTTNHVALGNSLSIQLEEGKPLSFETWFNIVNLTADCSQRGIIISPYFANDTVGGVARGFMIQPFTDGICASIGNTAYGVTGQSIANNEWHHMAATYDAGGDNKMRLYVDGNLASTTIAITSPASSVNNVSLGEKFRGISPGPQGQTDEMRFSKTTRSDGWIKTSYNNQNAPGTFLTWGNIEAGGGPVAYWNFDEGYASTTYDRVSNNDGTLQDNTTWVTGRFNTAIALDGTNDYVSVSDAAALDFSAATSFSLLAWAKHSTISTNPDYLLTKADISTGGYKLYMDSDGDFCIALDDDSTWNPDDSLCTTGANYDDDAWHQVIAVADQTANTLTLYVDGASAASGSITVTGTLENTNALYLGVDRDGSSNPWDGVIDDAKVYNYALTAEEVRGLFSAGAAAQPATAAFGANFGSANSDLDQHLTGYWNFDETATSTAVDISGLGNNGTDFYTTASSTGKYGYSRELNGTNGYVDLGSSDFGLSSTNEMTLSFWIYPMSPDCSDAIIHKGYYPFAIFYNCILEFWVRTDDTHGLTAASSPANNTWTHVTVTYRSGYRAIYYNGMLNASDNLTGNFGAVSGSLNVGRPVGVDSNYFDGLIDDVKIFNAALSDEQILQEYLDGPGPVGYWNFEEKTGTTANDVSGYGYNGTLTGGPMWDIGKVGSAVRFDGVDDYVSIPDSPYIEFTGQYTISLWYITDPSATGDRTIYHKPTDAYGNDMYIQVNSGNLTVWVGNTSVFNGVSGFSTSNTWRHVTLTHNGTNTLLYNNGVQVASTGSYIMSGSALPAQIGADRDGAANYNEFFDGKIDEVKIYNYARTPRDIAFDYNGGGPVGYWKFDEGYASTTYDVSGRGKNGTLQDNTLWTLNGKFGAALNFDGSNDYVDIGNLNASTSAVSFWVYPDALNKDIIDFDGGTHSIEVSSGGVLSATGFTSPKIYVNGARSTALTTGSWQHVAVTTDTPFGVSALQIGTETSFFDGKIDDIKLYTYTRTPAEIRQDYAAGGSSGGQGSTARLGSTRTSGSSWDDGGFGGAAPVGWWKFDEKNGQSVNDKSGTVITAGTLGVNSSIGTDDPTWELGKVGQALRFDGSNDYVNIGSTGQSVQTASVWIKADSTTGDIIDFDGGTHSIEISSGTLTATGWASPVFYINASSTTGNGIVPVNSWKHITVTTGTGFTASNLQVGTETAFFDGLIDEVKLYSYARSLPQIAFDYDGGKPLGHWKFDEGEGGTARDATGNGKHGTLYAGTGGDITATSSMWSVNGKINGALSFDGTDDYVNIGSLNASISAASLWVKADALNSDIMDFDGGTHSIEMSAAGTVTATGWSSPTIYINGSDTAALPKAVTTGTWYHITVTSATAFSATALQIGTETSYFNGLIDDVRIYSYARSADQVKQDYNNGASVRF